MTELDDFTPTHIVSFYGIRCEWDEHQQALRACRPWQDILVTVIAGLHIFVAVMIGRKCTFSLRIICEL